ncbi:MAG: hypothetical protein AAF696_16090 [Bacteroidota bacterium]
MKNILWMLGITLISSACVQKTIPHTVSIEVDMRQLEGVESVGIRGQYPPLSWNEDFPLSDPDADSIYSGSFIMDIPYDDFQFKFVMNGSEFELAGQDNRVLTFEGKTEVSFQAVFDQR